MLSGQVYWSIIVATVIIDGFIVAIRKSWDTISIGDCLSKIITVMRNKHYKPTFGRPLAILYDIYIF